MSVRHTSLALDLPSWMRQSAQSPLDIWEEDIGPCRSFHPSKGGHVPSAHQIPNNPHQLSIPIQVPAPPSSHGRESHFCPSSAFMSILSLSFSLPPYFYRIFSLSTLPLSILLRRFLKERPTWKRALPFPLSPMTMSHLSPTLSSNAEPQSLPQGPQNSSKVTPSKVLQSQQQESKPSMVYRQSNQSRDVRGRLRHAPGQRPALTQ